MACAGTPHDCHDDAHECDHVVIGPMPVPGGQASTTIEHEQPRQGAPTRRTTHDCRPFVLQAGRSLFIVAEEGTGWVVAELSFDPQACIFVEVSRLHFQWPREAYGRLLSRAYIGEGDEHELIDRITDDFQEWLAAQFVA